MKNSLCVHLWMRNEFNIFIFGVLTHPRWYTYAELLVPDSFAFLVLLLNVQGVRVDTLTLTLTLTSETPINTGVPAGL